VVNTLNNVQAFYSASTIETSLKPITLLVSLLNQ